MLKLFQILNDGHDPMLILQNYPHGRGALGYRPYRPMVGRGGSDYEEMSEYESSDEEGGGGGGPRRPERAYSVVADVEAASEVPSETEEEREIEAESEGELELEWSRKVTERFNKDVEALDDQAKETGMSQGVYNTLYNVLVETYDKIAQDETEKFKQDLLSRRRAEIEELKKRYPEQALTDPTHYMYDILREQFDENKINEQVAKTMEYLQSKSKRRNLKPERYNYNPVPPELTPEELKGIEEYEYTEPKYNKEYREYYKTILKPLREAEKYAGGPEYVPPEDIIPHDELDEEDKRDIKLKTFNAFKEIHTARQAKEFNDLELERLKHNSSILTIQQNEFNARVKYYTRNIVNAKTIGELRLATIDYINKIGEENDMVRLKETIDKLFGYYDYKIGNIKGLLSEPNIENFRGFINSIIDPIQNRINESHDVNEINKLYLKLYFVRSYLEFYGEQKLIEDSNISNSKKTKKISMIKQQLQQLYQIVDGKHVRVYSRLDYDNEMSNISAPNSGVQFEKWVVSNKNIVLGNLGYSGTLSINSDVNGYDNTIDIVSEKLKIKDLTVYDLSGSEVNIECKYYTTYSESSLSREHNGMFPLQKTKFLGNTTFDIYFTNVNGQMKLYGMYCNVPDNKGWFPNIGPKDYYLLAMGESFMYKYKLNINDESLYLPFNELTGNNGEKLYIYNFGKIAQKFKHTFVEFHGKKSPCLMIPFSEFEKVIIRK